MKFISSLFLWGGFNFFQRLSEKKQAKNQISYFDSLMKETKDDITLIDTMDGHTFEHYVAHVLKQNGYSNVEVTSGSNDFGVDIIAEKYLDRFAIQVKRQNSKVSRRAVSDAVAGKSYYSCNKSMVITNNHMSPSGFQFAEQVDCEIIQRNDLIELIERAYLNLANSSTMESLTPTSRTAQKLSNKCPNCNSPFFEHDDYWDEFICSKCGWVLTGSVKTNEVLPKTTGDKENEYKVIGLTQKGIERCLHIQAASKKDAAHLAKEKGVLPFEIKILDQH